MRIQAIYWASLSILLGSLSVQKFQPAAANPVVVDGSTLTQIAGSSDCSSDCVITGTSQPGNNQFHSFDRLNVPNAVTVVFEGEGIDNIFSRVTGGEASDLEGKLKITGDANFFLLNPSGIIFHPGSSLDLRGSFVASTGNAIAFEDGTQFLATDPAPLTLLTVSAPVGLGFGINPGRIQVQGALLPGPAEAIASGQTFALIGGDIDVLGSQLLAPDGNLLLHSAAAGESVSLLSSDNGFALRPDWSGQGNDIQVQQSQLNISGLAGGGQIHLRGNNTAITSSFLLDTPSPLATRDSGGIRLQAREQLSLEAGTNVVTVTSNIGQGGAISLEAQEVSIAGLTNPIAPALTIINASTDAQGNGGEISLLAETINIQDFSRLATETRGVGHAGDLNIEAQAFSLIGSLLGSISLSDGTAGDLNISIGQEVKLEGVMPFFRVPAGLVTNIGGASNSNKEAGGNISLHVGVGNPNEGELFLRDGALISSFTFDSRDAANIFVSAPKIILSGAASFAIPQGQVISPTGFFSESAASASGKSGNIQVQTETLQVLDGALIGTRTFGTGNAGQINIKASEQIQIQNNAQNLEDMGISVQALPTGTGTGGKINLQTPLLSLSGDSAGIFANTLGSGTGGDIVVDVAQLKLSDGAVISAETASSDGGNIVLTARDNILMRRRSSISATAGTVSGQGNGGNISIQTPFLVAPLMEDSDIIANAFAGSGGNITIATQVLLGLEPRKAIPGNGTNDIDASSEAGTNGEVAINQLIDSDNIVAVEISAEPTDAAQLIGNACNDSSKFGGQFIMTGRGGLPPSPSDGLGVWMPLIDSETAAISGDSETTLAPVWGSTDWGKQLEAQGWRTTATGSIELLASIGNYRPERRFVSCQGLDSQV